MRTATRTSALAANGLLHWALASLLTAVVLVVPGSAQADVRPLSWSAPTLSAPVVVNVTNTARSLALDNAKDYRVVMPSYPLAGQLSISGGRNVVLIGGQINIPTGITDPAARRGLYLKNQTGTVHIEGLSITGDLAEGINLDQRLGATVQLQNLYLDTVKGSQAGNHADVLQTWGGPKVLRIDGLRASTTYQGMLLLPHQMDSTLALSQWQFRNIDITSTPGSGYGLWEQDGLDIASSNVYWHRSDGTTNKSYWPSVSAWPGATIGAAPYNVLSTAPGLAYATPATPPDQSATGQWMVASDGGVFTFGGAPFLGSTGSLRLNKPIVGMAPTVSNQGYWLVASDGGIFSFGDAPFLGSTGAMRLNKPIVGMARTKTGLGYWLVASDGGIFSFGDAPFFGSTGAIRLNQPIVGMAASPSGLGYWMVASDGGIFAFGDADFYGSTGGIRLNQPIAGMTPTASGRGYWMVASDGGVFTFGDAPFNGSATGIVRAKAVSIQRVGNYGAYRIVDASGWSGSFGGALDLGFINSSLVRPVVGAAA